LLSISKGKMSSFYRRPPLVPPTFNDLKIPEGYVAGLGRGAVGFASTTARRPGDTYTAEDDEADSIFDAVDARMRNRSKKRRRNGDGTKAAKSTVADQFKDLKAEMSVVSADEWANIPDIGDYTIKHRKTEQFMPVPENIIMEKVNQNVPEATAVHGLRDVRGQLLERKLDTLAGDVGAIVGESSNMDGYLSSLEAPSISIANIGDINKTRRMLASVCESNPTYAASWVAAARLEENDNKLVAARKILHEGCQHCPKSEDLWLEIARLEKKHVAKLILKQATKHIPASESIWIRLAELENTALEKKAIFRKALLAIPTSVKLWKLAVDTEDHKINARIMLSRAVECVPKATDLWLALAKLESYEQARKVLNNARSSIPTEGRIYMAAAHLEETNANCANVEKIIRKAIKSVTSNNTNDWLDQAVSSERLGFSTTAGAIVRTCFGGDAVGGDKSNWMDTAKRLHQRKAPLSARALCKHALTYRADVCASDWLDASALEEDNDSVCKALLMNGLERFPDSFDLWKVVIDLEKATNPQGVQQLFDRALSKLPLSKEMWLLAIQEAVSSNYDERVLDLYARAKVSIRSSEDIYVRVGKFEKSRSRIKEARVIFEEGRRTIMKCPMIWLETIQLELDEGKEHEARQLCKQAFDLCPDAPDLYLCLANYEAKSSMTKARSILERGRLRNPLCPRLWLTAVKLERSLGNTTVAENLMSQALQKCPNAGILHANEILDAPRIRRKAKAFEALKRCENDAHVMLACSKMFYDEGKYETSKKWYVRAMKAEGPSFFISGDGGCNIVGININDLATELSKKTK
jgi:pre-mRNA-processing factor 6